MKQRDGGQSWGLRKTRMKQRLLEMTGPHHLGAQHSNGCLRKSKPVNIPAHMRGTLSPAEELLTAARRGEIRFSRAWPLVG